MALVAVAFAPEWLMEFPNNLRCLVDGKLGLDLGQATWSWVICNINHVSLSRA